MLRIAKLARNKFLIRTILRSGPSNWERPDPPPSLNIPIDHQLTEDEIIFSFFSRNTNQFFLCQPEVYQGDTIFEVLPSFIRGWGILFGVFFFVGALGYFTNPKHGLCVGATPEYLKVHYQKEKAMHESKKWTTWAKNNPMDIGVNPSTFFPEKAGDRLQYWKKYQDRFNYISTINGEMRSYLTRIKDNAEEKVRKRKGHDINHGEFDEHHTTH